MVQKGPHNNRRPANRRLSERRAATSIARHTGGRAACARPQRQAGAQRPTSASGPSRALRPSRGEPHAIGRTLRTTRRPPPTTRVPPGRRDRARTSQTSPPRRCARARSRFADAFEQGAGRRCLCRRGKRDAGPASAAINVMRTAFDHALGNRALFDATENYALERGSPRAGRSICSTSVASRGGSPACAAAGNCRSLIATDSVVVPFAVAFHPPNHPLPPGGLGHRRSLNGHRLQQILTSATGAAAPCRQFPAPLIEVKESAPKRFPLDRELLTARRPRDPPRSEL